MLNVLSYHCVKSNRRAIDLLLNSSTEDESFLFSLFWDGGFAPGLTPPKSTLPSTSSNGREDA
jgi:hypothetical protein